MNTPDLKSLRGQAKNLEAVLRIGKFGLTDNVHNEIDKMLKIRKLIKIKMLNNCPEDIDDVIGSVIEKSKAILVSKVGSVFTLYRESSNKEKK
jgi:RNA-binding protein